MNAVVKYLRDNPHHVQDPEDSWGLIDDLSCDITTIRFDSFQSNEKPGIPSVNHHNIILLTEALVFSHDLYTDYNHWGFSVHPAPVTKEGDIVFPESVAGRSTMLFSLRRYGRPLFRYSSLHFYFCLSPYVITLSVLATNPELAHKKVIRAVRKRKDDCVDTFALTLMFIRTVLASIRYVKVKDKKDNKRRYKLYNLRNVFALQSVTHSLEAALVNLDCMLYGFLLIYGFLLHIHERQ